MDRVSVWRDPAVEGQQAEKKREVEQQVLRNKLINLTLDWELAALTLDSQRYAANAHLERESLRDTANTYRKCVAELSEILSSCTMIACKAQ